MPAPVLPGHPGLYAKDRTPDRRTMGKKQGCSTAGATAVSGAACDAWPRLHRTFRHGAAGGAQGQIAHLLPGSKQNLQKEGDRPVETAPREGMRHFPKRPGATGKHWRRIPAESLPAGLPVGCRGNREPLSSPLPVSRNGKRDPFRSPSIFQISPGCGLPAGFTHTGQFAAQGHVAEADTADAELAHEGPGTPADGATIVGAGAELGLTGSLHFKSGTGHSSTPTCGTACPAGPEGTCLPCPWSPR